MKTIILLALICFANNVANAQWQATNGPGIGLSGLITCMAVNNNSLYVSTYGGGIFMSTNQGNSWASINNGLNQLSIKSIVSSGNYVVAIGDMGPTAYLSTNGGSTWNQISTLGGIQDIAVKGTTLFAASSNSFGVLMSINNGVTWTSLNNGMPGTTMIISIGVSPWGDIYASAFSTGFVYKSTNNGSNWVSINSGLNSVSVNFFAFSQTHIYAGTYSGVYMLSNGGALWSSINNGLTDLNNTGVQALAANGNTLIGSSSSYPPGKISISTNNGSSWTPYETGLPNLSVRALAIYGSYFFAGNYGNGVYKRAISDVESGVSEIKSENSLPNVFPNPSNGLFKIDFSQSSNQFDLIIYNNLGEVIFQNTNTNQNCDIDISSEANGIYFLEIKLKDKIGRAKIIKE